MDMEYLKEILAALRREFSRFRALSALVFAIVLIGVVCAGMFWPRGYESNALVYIDSASIIEPLVKGGKSDISNADRAEQAQKLIYTRSLLKATAEQVGVLDEDSSPEKVNTIIKHLRNSVTIAAEGKNYFRLTYWDSNPDRSYQVLDALVETFIGNRAAAKQSDSGEAFDFIQSQVQLYKAQLDDAERKLKENKANSPNTTEEAVKTRIANLTTEIEDLEITVRETESKIATTRELLEDEDKYLDEQAGLSSLQERRRALKTELEQLRRNYQESYPDIVLIKQQLAEVEDSLRKLGSLGDLDGALGKTGEDLFGELRKQLSVAEVDLKSQRRRLQSLNELRQEQFHLADQVADNKAHLDQLTRNYNVTVDVYEELLSRQENAKLSVALNQKGGGQGYQVVEPPVYPLEPGGPKFYQFALAAPVLGLGAPLGLLLAFILVDPRVRSVSSLVQTMPPEIELMGVTPHFESPAENRAARVEIAMLALFCIAVAIGYGFLVFAGLTGRV